MQLLIPLTVSIGAGLATLGGALITYLKIDKAHLNQFITFCLSFSLAIMLGLSVLDLIPEALNRLLQDNGKIITLGIVFSFLLEGILITLVLNKLISYLSQSNNKLYRLGILNMLALMLHNIPEGIITLITAVANLKLGIKMALAIIMHNIPEGIAIAVPIYYATKNRLKAFKMVLLSSLAEILGTIGAFTLLKNQINNKMIATTLILTAGIMITLAIHEILPEAQKYNEKKHFNLGLITGILVIIISLFIW